MRKKVTNEEVAEAIRKMAIQLRNEIIYDYHDTKENMDLAEKKLIDTLSKEQLELFKDYSQKKDAFFAVAKELYKIECSRDEHE